MPIASSAGGCSQPVAVAISIQGRVEASAEGSTEWTPVRQQDRLCPGDRLRVGANSRAALTLNDETLLRLAENSSVRISAPETDGSAWLDLMEGIGHFISRVRNAFQVNTPYVNASIEGTEFTVSSTPQGAAVTVLEGHVLAANDQGGVRLNGGERAQASPGQAPRAEAVVDPLDAVQWTLYYPPITEPKIENAPAALRPSLESYRRGDSEGAFAALSAVDDLDRQADLLVYRAALHLQVGGTQAAERDLAAALRLAPQQGDALALQSIIATVRNQPQQSLEMARQAVAAAPGTPAPLLALSYAEQARFQLEAALEAARQATRAAPDSALAWSRLAELHLMFHQLDEAQAASRRAVEIDPDQPMTLTTLGFSHLIGLDTERARQAFSQAIKLDQAAPLPRLGLGLAEIREGRVADGRRQLETAANLDPGNALIRSYLGKAYYEEKRDHPAASQFELAKQFDGLDPTAWFYDAILKQSQNRPVEALSDLQTSIDLNDNRAVYRSRLLLDQDEATRNTSQARIFRDLGFDQLATNEAYKSLQSSPQTHSAHRLISDSYIGKPSYQSARVSELLQSQLLQPLNTTPIQPQLGVSRLGILDGAGPSTGGYAEYNPLFTRKSTDIQLNAIGGSNGTLGDDLVLSGLRDRVSFSLGQFHYESDGWRENSDQEQDIYNGFVQYSLSDSTSVQFEYLKQDAETGDLGLRFDPDVYSPIERHTTERRLGRLGLHHQPSENSDLIASVIYQDLWQQITVNDTQYYPSITTPFGSLPGTVDQVNITTSDSKAYNAEFQYIQRLREHVITLGAGSYREDLTDSVIAWQTLTIFDLPVPPFTYTESLVTPSVYADIDPQRKDAYLYTQWALPLRLNLTLGAGYADFENAVVELEETDPKLGLTWEALRNLVFRMAYLEGVSRPSSMEQTIEPTQVAGFNQRFDDIPGSKVKQSGFGVDARAGQSLYLGAEYNHRKLQAPLFLLGGSGDTVFEDQKEDRYLAYLYWATTNRMALSLSYENEQFERELLTPEALDTQSVPIGISYHWPSGVYLNAVGTYVDQEITQSGVREQDEFWSLDSVIGYRLPNRLGKAEIIMKNILDKEFDYYDLNFRSWEPMLPKYQPERQLFVRFTLNF